MNFPGVLGQDKAAASLAGLLAGGKLPHALLFSGPEGTGKTLMALAFAKALLCRARGAGAPACGSCEDCRAIERGTHFDLARVNAASQAALREEEFDRQRTLRVDTIRHLRSQMEMRPLGEGWKIAVLEEAHTLETEAANALLKILEEPAPRTIWVLTSSQRERIPKTVLSRCARVPFQPLAPEAVAVILEARGQTPARAKLLAGLCEGSASRALELAEREYPESLLSGPLAAVEASESLPKELAAARIETERALFALAQTLRLRHLEGRLSWAAAGGPLAQLERLRACLRSNADPRSVMFLACIEAERALA